MISNERILHRLRWPEKPVDVVLDTDTYNEVDDQFALAYMIASDDKLNVKGIYAAPFQNERAQTPALGMERSYREIENILNLCGRPELMQLARHGAARFLPDEKTPVDSEAAQDLIRLAMQRPDDSPLYVLAIAAITNVASALLMQPEIADKIVVVWLGGNAHHWPDTREFNMFEDIAAARVVMNSGVPLVQLPCMGVVTHLATTGPELKKWLEGKNRLCDYLYQIVRHDEEDVRGCVVWNRVIWDISTVAWLLHPGFYEDQIVHTPLPTYDGFYSFSNSRHLMKYVYMVHRDGIFEDLFRKLAAMDCGEYPKQEAAS